MPPRGPRRPVAKKRRQVRGFTLLELLVSLGLLAIMAGFLFSSIGTVGRAWQHIETAGARTGDQAVRDYIQRRLSQAAYVLRRTGGAGDVLAFAGSPDKVRFVAETDGSLSVAGLYDVTIGLDEDAAFGAAARSMLVEEKLYRPRERSQVDPRHAHRRELASNIVSLKFRYFGRQSFEDQAAKWHESWTSRRYLPRLVSVQISAAGADRQTEQWPEIIAGTRLGNTRLSGN